MKEIINEELLKAGLALVDERYLKDKKYRDKWLKLQTTASNEKVGFWSNEAYVAKEVAEKIKKYQKKK